MSHTRTGPGRPPVVASLCPSTRWRSGRFPVIAPSETRARIHCPNQQTAASGSTRNTVGGGGGDLAQGLCRQGKFRKGENFATLAIPKPTLPHTHTR